MYNELVESKVHLPKMEKANMDIILCTEQIDKCEHYFVDGVASNIQNLNNVDSQITNISIQNV